MSRKKYEPSEAMVKRSIRQINEEIANYERMYNHAADRLAEMEARHETHPKKREMLNHFKVRLRGDLEAFANQMGYLECEKMGLEN